MSLHTCGAPLGIDDEVDWALLDIRVAGSRWVLMALRRLGCFLTYSPPTYLPRCDDPTLVPTLAASIKYPGGQTRLER